MDLHVEECPDIEHWYINTPLTHCTNTYIFVDCVHTCHARWTYHTHHKYASYAWINSHYDCLVASCISMSSMIYELVHFLSKFVVIFLDGVFIHNVQLQHPRETPKGELLPFEPSSNVHIGWAMFSLLSPSCCLHDTNIGWRTNIGDGPYGPSS